MQRGFRTDSHLRAPPIYRDRGLAACMGVCHCLQVWSEFKLILKLYFMLLLPWKLRTDNSINDESDGSSLGPCFHVDPFEEEVRLISSCGLKCVNLLQPAEKILQGPGAGPGPRRYLGVVKPMMLFHWCVRWCGDNGHSCPSLTTFMRVLHQCNGWLRFRKSAGQHPVCDTCWLLVGSQACRFLCRFFLLLMN